MRTQRREFSAKHWENANQKSRETTEQTFAREAGRPRECLSRDNVNAQCTDKSRRQLAVSTRNCSELTCTFYRNLQKFPSQNALKPFPASVGHNVTL